MPFTLVFARDYVNSCAADLSTVVPVAYKSFVAALLVYDGVAASARIQQFPHPFRLKPAITHSYKLCCK